MGSGRDQYGHAVTKLGPAGSKPGYIMTNMGAEGTPLEPVDEKHGPIGPTYMGIW